MRAMIKNEITGKFEDRTIEVLHDAIVECCGPNGWDLYANSDAISQQLKALSECGEACDSVNKGDYEQLKDDIGDIIVCLINWCQLMPAEFIPCWVNSQPHNSQEEIKRLTVELAGHLWGLPENVEDCGTDHIDTTLNCIRHICLEANIDPVECLGIAYDVISKRTGRMINGTFVKDLVTQ